MRHRTILATLAICLCSNQASADFSVVKLSTEQSDKRLEFISAPFDGFVEDLPLAFVLELIVAEAGRLNLDAELDLQAPVTIEGAMTNGDLLEELGLQYGFAWSFDGAALNIKKRTLDEKLKLASQDPKRKLYQLSAGQSLSTWIGRWADAEQYSIVGSDLLTGRKMVRSFRVVDPLSTAIQTLFEVEEGLAGLSVSTDNFNRRIVVTSN